MSTPIFTPIPTLQCGVRVNDDSGSAPQSSPVIGMDRLGNAVTTWIDGRAGDLMLYNSALLRLTGQWGPNHALVGSQQPNLGSPALSVGFGGEVIIVWSDNRDGDNDIYASWRRPGDVTFTPPLQVNDDSPTPAQQLNPAVVIDRAGTAHVLWVDNRLGNADIFWSKLPRGGNTWSPSRRVHQNGVGMQMQPALARDGRGAVYAAWVDNRGQQAVIAAAVLPPNSANWSPGEIVGGNASFPAGALPANPDIVVDFGGAVHVAWDDARDVAAGRDIYHSMKAPGPGGVWSQHARINDDSSGADQLAPRLAASPGGVIAVWSDERMGDGDIYRAWFGDQGWGENRRLNSDETTTSQVGPDVALDRDGNAFIVWTDASDPATSPDVYACFLSSLDRHRLYLPMTLQ
jgi:hypothetical protein